MTKEVSILDLEVNDILYTRDGRKIGNCVVVYKRRLPEEDHLLYPQGTIIDSTPVMYEYLLMSDYGTMISVRSNLTAYIKVNNRFYKKRGKASKGHKYYNFAKTCPEILL